MQDLIKEYKESLKSICQAKEETTIKSDREHLAAMERDLMYAIQWMTTGWEPGNRRGVERLASYQREKPVDPIHFQLYAQKPIYEKEEHSLSDWDMWLIEDALSTMSQLERDVYVMKVGQGFSMEKVAGFLGISKGSVQTMLKRAEKKMLKQNETSLFLVG